MSEFLRRHPRTTWVGAILGGLLCILGLFLAVFDWNSLRPMVARRMSAALGRQTAIDGDLKVHLWSFTPSAEINGITIKNPSWADRDLMFGAKRLKISVSLGHLLRGNLLIPEIDLLEPTINLERDLKGRASWELGSPAGAPTHDAKPVKFPTIRRFVISGGKLDVVDKIRKLTFSGSLVAADQAGKKDAAAFQVRCSGTLNAKPFRLEVNGGPLLDLEPDKPYSLDTHLTASDIRLDSQITIAKPFDLSSMQVKFDLSGDDLADVFYLTGLALPNTPKYSLKALVHVDGRVFRIENLQGRVGSSDLSGGGRIDTTEAIPRLTAKLSSNKLNIVDVAPALGAPAAAKDKSLAAAPPGPSAAVKTSKFGAGKVRDTPVPELKRALLLPDADLQVNRVRGMNADVTYHAAAVTAPKVPMREVSFHLVLDHGQLHIDPLSFVLDSGKFTGKVEIDARKTIPVSTIDMKIDQVDLAQFKSSTMKDAPLQGELQGRLHFHGAGTSVHKVAAVADGSMSIVIPHGRIREAFAELTGINVAKGLGLLLTKEDDQTDIRCGIIDFKAHEGSLNTTTVYVDTTNVLITGRGNINLGTEGMDLDLQGNPKKLRFVRLRSPISLHGTLANPAVGIEPEKLAKQVGAAAALGALLTPAAAALAFIDPGLAKDKDCSTLLAQADAGIKN